MSTLVLGIGNTLLSDEGAGVHVVNAQQGRFADSEEVTLLDGGTLSFTLAAAIEDAAHLIVVDASELKSVQGTVATAARTLEAKILADAMQGWYDNLVSNIKAGDVRIFNEELWDPASWPREARGMGYTEAPPAGHWLHDPKQPIEILRTIHSFDPCIACAVHVIDPEGEELVQVKVV